MTAGKLASAKPGATTDTFLYRCPIDKAASTVLNVVNQSGSSATYRVGLRDYDQVLTLDSAGYKFRKGNVISSYVLELTPGVQTSSLTPGDLISLTNNNASFRYLDIVKSTDTITIPVKILSIGSSSVNTPTGGTFSVGDTLTGTNGLTAEVYFFSESNNTLQLLIDGISNSDTSFRVSGDGSAVASADLLNVGTELIGVSSITDNQVTATRGESATTAAAHLPGSSIKIIRPTVDTTTLAANITDTAATSIDVADAASSNLTIGNYIRINDEFLLINGVATNTLTVARGQLGTTATTHTSGDTVTRHTDEGFVSLQYFENAETLDNGSGVTAVINVGSPSQNVFNPVDTFVYDLVNDGTFSKPPTLTLDIDRVYRFTQTDSSNTGELLGFKVSAEGAAYTTGVIFSGTPGTAGAYTQITISDTTPNSLFISGTSVPGGGVNVDSDPFYSEIYVYDVEGSVIATDSFETSTGSNDVVSVTSGPYGYVQYSSGATLKVSLGLNSSAFTTSDQFYDSPRTTGEVRSIVSISSTTTATDIQGNDYLFYGKTLAANTTDKNSGIVIGPGQSVVIYSSAADLNYVLNGFEDNTNDFSVIHYNRI